MSASESESLPEIPPLQRRPGRGWPFQSVDRRRCVYRTEFFVSGPGCFALGRRFLREVLFEGHQSKIGAEAAHTPTHVAETRRELALSLVATNR